MRTLLLSCVATVLLSAIAVAQPQVVIGPGLHSGRTEFHQTLNKTLSSDTTYILTGLYVVDSTRTLTIEPGTVIMGDTASTLIIARGAQIMAQGTVDNPIVFTSMLPPGSRATGDWGGVVVLGGAPTNQANPVIEGGIIPGTYGGGGIGLGNPDDNSGIISYVRIEFAGYRFQLNNEINGLTMGGVGRGTQIDHVQVSYAFDDSYECFGGTVDLKYMVAFGGWDDDFDTDFGFQGRIQFGFGLRDPDNSEISGVGESNGFESDNEGTPSETEPRTQPRYSNMTLIGPRRTDAIAVPPAPRNFQYVTVARRGTELSVYNSILMGFPGGYSMRDAFTSDAAIAGDLQERNVSIQVDGGSFTTLDPRSLTGGFDLTAWWNTAGWDNLGAATAMTTRPPSAIGLVDMSDLHDPDPRPMPGSEPTTASVEFTNLNMLADGYFTPTTYRGSFDPSLPMDQQWTAGWTNFDPQNTSYTTDVRETGNPLPEKFSLEQNYPNPFNPSTQIRFSITKSDHVILKVFNLLGEEVATLVNEVLPAGSYETEFSGASLPSGIYLYRITTAEFSASKRMILVK